MATPSTNLNLNAEGLYLYAKHFKKFAKQLRDLQTKIMKERSKPWSTELYGFEREYDNKYMGMISTAKRLPEVRYFLKLFL